MPDLPPNIARLNCYIAKNIHKQAKLFAVSNDLSLSAVVEQALIELLERHGIKVDLPLS